jgi:hypothetical protein
MKEQITEWKELDIVKKDFDIKEIFSKNNKNDNPKRKIK